MIASANLFLHVKLFLHEINRLIKYLENWQTSSFERLPYLQSLRKAVSLAILNWLKPSLIFILRLKYCVVEL